MLHERNGDFDTAAREFLKSVDGGVGEVSGLFGLAQIRRQEGNDDEAATLLERAHDFGKASS